MRPLAWLTVSHLGGWGGGEENTPWIELCLWEDETLTNQSSTAAYIYAMLRQVQLPLLL